MRSANAYCNDITLTSLILQLIFSLGDEHYGRIEQMIKEHSDILRIAFKKTNVVEGGIPKRMALSLDVQIQGTNTEQK